MAKKTYDEDSIQSLSPLEFTRLRPGVYVGSTEYSTQLLIEILGNAFDEFNAGHGDTINVTITKDNWITVEDNGQGFLVNSLREDGKTVLEASFSVLNTSGKYNDDGVYEGTALGLNGIGSKLATYLSHELIVTTYRDSKTEMVKFKEGVFESRRLGICNPEAHGTTVKWQPSEEFFTHPEVDLKVIKEILRVVTCLCPGLTVHLFELESDEAQIFSSQNGIIDLLHKGILKNSLVINFADGKNKLDLAMNYTDSYSSSISGYVNTGLTDSGPHLTQIKSILTRELNKFFREKGWLKEKDENLNGEDCQEGLELVFNITTPGVSYDAQTKSRIVKLDMKPFTQVIADSLQYWFAANEKDIKQIADKALAARKAREAAKKARDAARNTISGKKNKFIRFDSKLADCNSKNRKECEIIITEGDSASGGLKKARNNKFQAILPVRGKILNTQKATLDKIQQNAEIMSMIKAFGLTVDPQTLKLTYDPEKLRYGKIIIMSDADIDGQHIKNLFYTFIWNFCPQLILDGYIYAGVPPLYRITINKKYIYLKDDAALEEFRAGHAGKKYEVNRFKGVGEMSNEEAAETILSPTNRILKQVTVKDIPMTNQLFEDLMGSSVTNRRQYIINHAKEATINV